MTLNNNILICCDLDRTLLPNGFQPESPQARKLFRKLVQQPEVRLAYVSGRDQRLLLEAIKEFSIPVPDYAIGDVGTTIFNIKQDQWQLWPAWHEEISHDWNGLQHKELSELLKGIEQLRLQETEKQNTYKLSYYAATDINVNNLLTHVQQILTKHGVKASLIWSIDEQANVGLLDILPESANKLHAINFLIQHEGFQSQKVVFAGDSGNDIPVLASKLQAVLVNNAMPEIKSEAMQLAIANHTEQQLYIAQGNFMDMNGNYAAGILEGMAHYLPVCKEWLDDAN